MDKAAWVGVVDAVVSTVILLAGRFLAPSDAELVKFLVAAWQPVAVAVVLALAYKDGLLVKERIAQWEARLTEIKEGK